VVRVWPVCERERPRTLTPSLSRHTGRGGWAIPVMASTAHSDARIEFRLSAAQKAEIERAALAQNRSLTDFATTVLTETARKVLADHARHEHVQLSDRDRDRFLAMLDANASPNAALRAAAKKHRRRVA
jgi:uncharacterized protein (DUF1778 family)